MVRRLEKGDTPYLARFQPWPSPSSRRPLARASRFLSSCFFFILLSGGERGDSAPTMPISNAVHSAPLDQACIAAIAFTPSEHPPEPALLSLSSIASARRTTHLRLPSDLAPSLPSHPPASRSVSRFRYHSQERSDVKILQRNRQTEILSSLFLILLIYFLKKLYSIVKIIIIIAMVIIIQSLDLDKKPIDDKIG